MEYKIYLNVPIVTLRNNLIEVDTMYSFID